MDATHSHRLSRLSKLLLAGIGVAFAWVLLSFTLGLSTAQAHADDDSGLLGAVASTVEDTTSTVADTAAGTTAVAVETVAPVVETVAPVVQTITAVADPVVPVAPVVEVVDATVTPVVETVADIAASGVVAPIVDSTVGVVGDIPVVGGVVSGLGADDALSSVGHSVDGVLQGTTGAVADTVTDVVDTTGGAVTPPVLAPGASVEDVVAGTGADHLVSRTVLPPADAARASSAQPFETILRAVYLTGAAAWASLTSDSPAAATSAGAAAVPGGALGGALALLRSALQADSVLTGPAGAGPGAWVLVALGFVVAYRAWVRRTGLENDTAPAAPAYSTDVSPD